MIGAYLVYAVFDEWSYLRFLLPAMAVLAIFAAVELAAWIERWPIALSRAVAVPLMLGVTAHSLWLARSLDTFKLADQLRRVSQVADFINDDVPPAAVILAGEQSGSMRYYTDRPILRWEAASPEALPRPCDPRTITAPRLHRARRVGERAVPREVRRVPVGALDWPPVLEPARRIARDCGSWRSRSIPARRA